MSLNRRHTERGQTLTFWLFAVIAALALSLFVMNYSSTVRWHIRAQNAADSAALATVAADASLNNQRTMALYALAVSEYRVRSIAASMVNAANAVSNNIPYAATVPCDPALDDSGHDCDDAYDQEPAAFDAAVENYATALHNMQSINNAAAPSGVALPNGSGGTPPPLPNAPTGSAAPAAFSLAASNSNCWDQPGIGKPIFDCAFGYAANPDLSSTGINAQHEYVDIVTCRNVTQTSPGIFSGPATFVAVGRAAATLRAIAEPPFNPGMVIDPAPVPTGTKPPYQRVESCPPSSNGTTQCSLSQGWLADRRYVTDYSGLTVSATFYVPQATAPVNGIPANEKVCKNG